MLYFGHTQINQFEADLKASGYKVRSIIVRNYSRTTRHTPTRKENAIARNVRDWLCIDWKTLGLVGAIFIGDLPIPMYKFKAGFAGQHEATFPMDLYYKDLDGIWKDTDGDNIYDTHTGNVSPEIFIGHISPSNFSRALEADKAKLPTVSEVNLLKNYFERNHNYRTKKLFYPHKALLYLDDNQAGHKGVTLRAMRNVFADHEITSITDGSITTGEDLKGRLKENYKWVHLESHGDPHYINIENSPLRWVTIARLAPSPFFYFLSGCETFRFAYPGEPCIGESLLFYGNGLCAIGSTKKTRMNWPENFYPQMKEGKGSIGESFLYWSTHNGQQHGDYAKWLNYGMVILGDPTLKVIPEDQYHFEGNKWHLVSFPRDPYDPNPDAVIKDDCNWYYFLFGYNSQTGNYISSPSIKIGKGYWLWLEKDTAIDVVGTSADQSTDFSIPIEVGLWQLIGNPFNFPIDLENVKIKRKVEGDTVPLPDCPGVSILTGANYYPNRLEPWGGYWVKSAVTEGEILISPIESNSPPQAAPLAKLNQSFSDLPPELPSMGITPQAIHTNPSMKITLSQNYPNPVNPETWIPFSLAEDSNVTVRIYNLSGSLVRALDLGRRPAGNYSDKNMAAHWDGKDENGEEVASGTYLYQLQAGPAIQTRKMIVLK